jgi:hypothetical protein
VSDLSTNMVTNFLATTHLLGFSAHEELNLVSVVVFDGIHRIFHVLDRPADCPPGRARLIVGLVCNGGGVTFGRR